MLEGFAPRIDPEGKTVTTGPETKSSWKQKEKEERTSGQHRQSQRIPESVTWALVADTSPPKPATPDFLEAYSPSGCPLAP